jgi:flagellar biosynthesis chaperone FliJ
LNDDAYVKPYEYVIKNVATNTEELINGLKKLNTNIKKYIDKLTSDKEPQQVIKEFFQYHDEIGSKAYHRIKTSDHISKFRATIIVRLKEILRDRAILDKAVLGYMEIEEINNVETAEENLRNQISDIINAFHNYSGIIDEIERKNKKYQQCAVERAKFLLANGVNVEGKIKSILNLLSKKFNDEENLNLYDQEDFLLDVFKIFPQNFIDTDSLYTEPIRKKIEIPPIIDNTNHISEEERLEYERRLREKYKNSFSQKNIEKYITENLKRGQTVIASALPLESKRDLIRIIFIQLYGFSNSLYEVTPKTTVIDASGFRFGDFEIRRK